MTLFRAAFRATFRARFAIAFAGLAAVAASARAQDALVVAPKEFQPALTDWQRHRGAAGLTVVVREPAADAAGLVALVRAVRAESGGKLKFVFLLGDVDRIPCATRPVVATAQWERAPTIATDEPFADLDDDSVPDLAIGRYPAQSVADAKAFLSRVIAYETSRDFGDWRRRATVIAGTGGFGVIQDMALEMITKKFLVASVPLAMTVSATYGNPLSAWCPPPAEFQQTTIDRWNDGALLFAYIGHGSPRELDRVKMGRERYPIFTADDPAKVNVAHGAPVAVFIACSTGRFDGADDCLAEMLVRRERGPIAVIASSRVSTPYSNAILSKEMLEQMFAARAPTTGEMLLGMKRSLAAPAADPQRVELEKLAAAFYNPSDEVRGADRAEHQFLYNLLGDPMTVIQRPAVMPVTVPATVVKGAALVVTGDAPFAGELSLSFDRARDAPVAVRSRVDLALWRRAYEAANDPQIASIQLTVPKGPFRVELTVPDYTAATPHELRAYLVGKDGAAAGGVAVSVLSAAPDSDAPRQSR